MIKIKSFKKTETGYIPVSVEVELSKGIGIHVIGLADEELKQCLLRIIQGIQASGFKIPAEKIVINIAPQDVKNTSGPFDVAIAAAIIAASGQLNLPVADDFLVAGNMNADGSINACDDVNEMIAYAESRGYKSCIVPIESAPDIQKTEMYIYMVNTLKDVLGILSNPGNKQDL